MALTDYTFRLDTATTTGVVLNDDSTSIPFVDITRVSGLDSAPYRETLRDHEGVDGGFIDAEFEKGREIILEGIAYCDSSNVEPYFDTLKANYAPVTSLISFHMKIPGVSERVVFVKPRGVRYDIDQARRIGATNVQFLMYAEDPRIYDNSLQSVNIPFGGVTSVGFGFNFGFNLDFGGSVSPSGLFVTNNGNRPTPAIMTITGPMINPLIINDTLSASLSFSIVLANTDTLVIDLANRTVTLNGSGNRRGTLINPTWFLLASGANFIRFGGLSGSGSLNVSFRSAWR